MVYIYRGSQGLPGMLACRYDIDDDDDEYDEYDDYDEDACL